MIVTTMKISTAFIVSFLMIFKSSAMDMFLKPYHEKRDHTAIMEMIDAEPEKNYPCLLEESREAHLERAAALIKAHGTKKKTYGSEESYTTKVINDDNNLVGFVQYMLTIHTPILLDKILLVSPPPDIGYIRMISVDKDSRLNGCGMTLLHDAITDLKKHGATIIKLQVHSDNKSARKFFERAGFRVVKNSKTEILTAGKLIKYSM